MHGNSAEMPYDVSETQGNRETQGNAGKRGETPGKHPQEIGKGLPNNFVNETTIALKKRKREENLKNWKWEDVIVIDDVDVPNKVAETDTIWKQGNMGLPETGCIVFDVEEDEDEAENKNPWEFDDEDEFDNEVADEDEVDDEDEWL
ncbi:hypothetical protein Tco_0978325 [Tanacetum coccineum]|uniref:Uncharacterized protein n=1 Tax=Tanacetum coccineum TaxID=301880 RepID=A0ABQ5EML1_9ASTR